MKKNGTNKRNARGKWELYGTLLGIAAVVLVYLMFVCAVKGIGFTMVWVGCGAVLLAAAVGAAADRLME